MNCNNCIKSLEQHYRESTGITTDDINALFGSIYNLRIAIGSGKYHYPSITKEMEQNSRLAIDLEKIKEGLSSMEYLLVNDKIDKTRKNMLEKIKQSLLEKEGEIQKKLNNRINLMDSKVDVETMELINRKKSDFIKDLFIATKLIVYPNREAVFEVLRQHSWISNGESRNIDNFDPNNSTDLVSLTNLATIVTDNLPEKIYDKDLNEDGFLELFQELTKDREIDELDEKIGKMMSDSYRMDNKINADNVMLKFYNHEKDVWLSLKNEYGMDDHPVDIIIKEFDESIEENVKLLQDSLQRQRSLSENLGNIIQTRNKLIESKSIANADKMKKWLQMENNSDEFNKISYLADLLQQNDHSMSEKSFTESQCRKLNILFDIASIYKKKA